MFKILKLFKTAVKRQTHKREEAGKKHIPGNTFMYKELQFKHTHQTVNKT